MLDVKWLVAQLKSDNALIGVSGGADSMALLHMIASDRNKFSCNFKVLHVDHQINPESSMWSKTVEDYCISLDMPCEVVKVDITKWGNNQEQAARRSRYDAFSKQNFKNVILAHHADDQVETFFLKLFRGSGPKGLRCMIPVSPCWFDDSKIVIRPLLEFSKFQLEDYVEKHNIPHVIDPSNIDTSFDRNWIRHELMPFIQARNEIVDINVRKVASIQNESYNLMSDLARIDFKATALSNDTLDWKKVKELSISRIKNLVMFICAENNVIDLSIHHVESFAKGLVDADSESKNELRMKNFHISKVGKRIVINK
jgi:tRNA(Ile)-lysidine synthase